MGGKVIEEKREYKYFGFTFQEMSRSAYKGKSKESRRGNERGMEN